MGVMRCGHYFGRSVGDVRVIITSNRIDGVRIPGIAASQGCGMSLRKRTHIIGH